MARPAWLILGAVLAELSEGVAPRSAAEAFMNLAEAVPALRGLTYEGMGLSGSVSETAQHASLD